MEYMYHARRSNWGDTPMIAVTLPGTDGQETLLDQDDPRIVESNLDREWIITNEIVPGSWPDGDPSRDVYT